MSACVSLLAWNYVINLWPSHQGTEFPTVYVLRPRPVSKVLSTWIRLSVEVGEREEGEGAEAKSVWVCLDWRSGVWCGRLADDCGKPFDV